MDTLLAEALFILAVHEDKVEVIKTAHERLKAGLAGALLAELALMGHIQGSKNHKLQVVDGKPRENPILNEALADVLETEKEKKFGFWVETLAPKSEKIHAQLCSSLAQKGILAREDDHLYWVIPSPLQPDTKASAKYILSRRLRGVVLAQESFSTFDLVLLGLLRACNLLELVFLRDERKLAERFIREQVFRYAINDTALQVVQEIEAAVASVVEED